MQKVNSAFPLRYMTQKISVKVISLRGTGFIYKGPLPADLGNGNCR